MINCKELNKIAKEGARLPRKYRNNKNDAKKLINRIIEEKIRIENNDIYILAHWCGADIDIYKKGKSHTIVSSINHVGEEDVFDISVPEGNSYVGNGIVLHNCNLPKDASKELVEQVYKRAWEKGCKGFTIYRDGCRTGILVDNTKEKIASITKTHALKRPPVLKCDVYHTTSKGEQYFVLVGLLGNDGDPYEVFAGKNGNIKRTIRTGNIQKLKRGRYSLLEDNGEIILESISENISDDQEAITRLISSNLRHGCDVGFVVHQLEKVKGDLLSFAKALSRVLKKYIPDQTKIHGDICPECGENLVRIEGCATCRNCGWSRC